MDTNPFSVRVRREGAWFVAEALVAISADGALGSVAGARATTEEEARAKLQRVMVERDAAIAELCAMPVDDARAVIEEAKRLLAASGEHRSGRAEPLIGAGHLRVAVGARADAGIVATNIPASARTLRDVLVPNADEIGAAVLEALVATAFGLLAGRCGGQGASAHPAAGPDAPGPPPPGFVEREPAPAPPLPPLVTPADTGRAAVRTRETWPPR